MTLISAACTDICIMSSEFTLIATIYRTYEVLYRTLWEPHYIVSSKIPPLAAS